MFITKKHISRRTVLKGMGVTLALPMLDAMVPAGTALAKTTAAKSASKTRLIAIEMVHGAAGATEIGMQREHVVAGGGRHGLRSGPDEPEARSSPISEYLTDHQQHRATTPPRRGRRRRSAATTSGRARPT